MSRQITFTRTKDFTAFFDSSVHLKIGWRFWLTFVFSGDRRSHLPSLQQGVQGEDVLCLWTKACQLVAGGASRKGQALNTTS